MGACAVLTVGGRDGGAVLSVVAPDGGTAYRAGVITGAADAGAPTGDDLVAAVLAAADEDLTAAGWVRAGDWVPGSPPGPPLVPRPSGSTTPSASREVGEPTAPPVTGAATAWAAPVAARPRLPLVGADQRALEALGRLTAMARGPVTAAALVPLVVPRWQAAAAVLRRLVETGHVRVVGTTGGRIARRLYAPVGTSWAPRHDDAPGTSGGAGAG